MRASWRDGRMWALVPASGGGVEGVAITKSFHVGGGAPLSVTVNYVAVRGGNIRVAAQLPNGSSINGFEREACVALASNATAAIVTWHGSSSLPRTVESVRLVFYLRRARLYGFLVKTM